MRTDLWAICFADCSSVEPLGSDAHVLERRWQSKSLTEEFA
jgi:hypothetical protein